MAAELIGLRRSFEAMQGAKGPVGSFDLVPAFEEAFVRAASRSSTPGISRAALSALRAVHDTGRAVLKERDRTEGDR
jgi:hypothetical protein